jgi:hypothetical protein
MSSVAARLPLALVLAVAIWLVSTGHLLAQGRTDVVTLGNGDRITGEVKKLDRGRLEFKTDDAGTLYFEWDKLMSVVAHRLVEVETTLGDRYLGSLVTGPPKMITVSTVTGEVDLAMADVTLIHPIGRSFWSKLDGSIDAGFTYTQSSGIAQFTLNSDTVYRKPASSFRLAVSATQTRQRDGGDDDRAMAEMSYLRFPWQRWFLFVAGRLETNESLGLELRSQAGVAVGPRLVNSNRAQMAAGAGIVVNDEQAVDGGGDQNVEAMLLWRTSYFTYDAPRTNLDASLQYYPSLSDPGRQRLQIDLAVKREFFKDFFVSLSLYDSFDNRPPSLDAEENDVGVVLSFGWSY